ncbi:TetR/AcrR family transcriptional regulator [Nocardia jejuensis]|uniref:TetR/AcrR family transcriptional regulator n=1 Tax=Nocardia jejuensis TaxID=328049 RepID=UPI00082F9156|nr:TetR family transcriptional regulator [Nocardia jejuensis]
MSSERHRVAGAHRYRRMHHEVLDAAETLFTTADFRTVTLADIGAATGHRAGSIFAHFATTEAVLIEVLHRHYERTLSPELIRLATGDTLEGILDFAGRRNVAVPAR